MALIEALRAVTKADDAKLAVLSQERSAEQNELGQGGGRGAASVVQDDIHQTGFRVGERLFL